MKNNPLLFFTALIIFSFSACLENNEDELILSCEPETVHYGGFILRFYDGNPNQSGNRRPIRQEVNCWSDLDPIQISAQGAGNCGEGYETYFENPFLGPSIVLGEYDPEINYFKKALEVRAIFSCMDFSTRESFFNLFKPAQYGLATDFEDFGNFVIEYFENGISYSSLGVANSIFNVTLSDIEQISINNADFVVSTVRFNALLKSENGQYLKVENAEVRGRFFRMSPFGVEWEE
ncbi:hypothetical protein [Cecembia sp.]|uniref:hypothetical protein n=1 Tax=Cecembia sp. TaxID=1898110 RepID=UPI0025C5041C|nr:hypothetical protein [Cecembia sp.]